MISEQFDLLILGASGHGMVVKEMAWLMGYRHIGMFDDSEPANFKLLSGVFFLGTYDNAISADTPLIIAIGNNEVRYKMSQRITHPFATLIHPTATVSPSVSIGVGSVVLAGAVVQARTIIGTHNIINANAVVDHDVTTGTCVHVRPQAYIGSDSTISDYLTVNPSQVVERFSKL